MLDSNPINHLINCLTKKYVDMYSVCNADKTILLKLCKVYRYYFPNKPSVCFQIKVESGNSRRK